MFGKLLSKFIGKVDKTILIELMTFLTVWKNSLNHNYQKFDTTTVIHSNYCRDASPALILESINDVIYDNL
jgi:hypothetical protein